MNRKYNQRENHSEWSLIPLPSLYASKHTYTDTHREADTHRIQSPKGSSEPEIHYYQHDKELKVAGIELMSQCMKHNKVLKEEFYLESMAFTGNVHTD